MTNQISCLGTKRREYKNCYRCADAKFSLSFFQESMDEQERERMREASKRLYAQMQDAEKRHLEERERLLVSLLLPIVVSEAASHPTLL